MQGINIPLILDLITRAKILCEIDTFRYVSNLG